ncbi:unnamed protein product, partial [Ectocarpus sp. 12 AP-2014]
MPEIIFRRRRASLRMPEARLRLSASHRSVACFHRRRPPTSNELLFFRGLASFTAGRFTIARFFSQGPALRPALSSRMSITPEDTSPAAHVHASLHSLAAGSEI